MPIWDHHQLTLGPEVGSIENAGKCCEVTRFCVTGYALGGLNAVDTLVQAFMETNGIPNMSIGIVAPEGHLALARGYTNCAAFPATSQIFLAQPTSRYRIMSISKTFTATAVMMLQEAGKLRLTDTLGRHISMDFRGHSNPHLENVRLWEVLCHLSDVGHGLTPAPGSAQIEQADTQIAAQLGRELPLSEADLVEYAARFVTFDPPDGVPCTTTPPPGVSGPDRRAWIYSNFGYLLLGRVVRAVSGKNFSQYVEDKIFGPLGMRDMAPARASKTARDRASDEVEYYYTPNSPTLSYPEPLRSCQSPYGRSVVDGTRPCVEIPYGGRFNINNFDAFGGWIGNVIDLCTWGWAMRDPSTVRIISPDSLRTMSWDWTTTRCSGFGNYGLGWSLNIQSTGDRGHRGSKEGSRSQLYMFPSNRATHADGAVVAILMNRHPDEAFPTPQGAAWTGFMNALLGRNATHGLLDNTVDWGTASDIDAIAPVHVGEFADIRTRIELSDRANVPYSADSSWLENLVVRNQWWDSRVHWPFLRPS